LEDAAYDWAVSVVLDILVLRFAASAFFVDWVISFDPHASVEHILVVARPVSACQQAEVVSLPDVRWQAT